LSLDWLESISRIKPSSWSSLENTSIIGKRYSCRCAQLIKHYAMKVYGGVDVSIHIFLTSALVGGEWSASRPSRFTPTPPGETAPSTHWIGGWLDPRASLDDLEKRKFLTLLRLELRLLSHPAHSQSLYWLRYPGSYFHYRLSLSIFLLAMTCSCLKHYETWAARLSNCILLKQQSIKMKNICNIWRSRPKKHSCICHLWIQWPIMWYIHPMNKKYSQALLFNRSQIW
jgi:hypothetical protein